MLPDSARRLPVGIVDHCTGDTGRPTVAPKYRTQNWRVWILWREKSAVSRQQLFRPFFYKSQSSSCNKINSPHHRPLLASIDILYIIHPFTDTQHRDKQNSQPSQTRRNQSFRLIDRQNETRLFSFLGIAIAIGLQ
jgi:hypothetical protein